MIGEVCSNMDVANINNADNEIDQQQEQVAHIMVGVENPAAAAAVDPRRREVIDANAEDDNDDATNNEDHRRRRWNKQKLNSALDLQDSFPLRQRNKIDDLMEEFLTNLKKDIHDMICDQEHGDDYHGLDADRDTEAEVELALRFFPENLSKRKENVWDYDEGDWVNADEDHKGEFPIQCISCQLNGDDADAEFAYNRKTMPFFHSFARLATEFGSFEKEERGGLLLRDIDGYSSLRNLVWASGLYGDLIFNEMVLLCRMGLLRKEDICTELLVCNLCCHGLLHENLLRFFVEWDPASLAHVTYFCEHDRYPLHDAAFRCFRSFRLLFDLIIRFFPKKKGICLLFLKGYDDKTPFQKACEKFKRENVMTIVDDTLTRYSNETPIDTGTASMLAAVDSNIHLDCVYFLLRRYPIALINLLQPKRNADNDHDIVDKDSGGGYEGINAAAAADGDDGDADMGVNDIHVRNETKTSKKESSQKLKRKRDG